MSARFRIAMLRLNKAQKFRNNILWNAETKVEFDHHAQFGENQTHDHKYLITAVKHGGGGVIIWACFAVIGSLTSLR